MFRTSSTRFRPRIDVSLENRNDENLAVRYVRAFQAAAGGKWIGGALLLLLVEVLAGDGGGVGLLGQATADLLALDGHGADLRLDAVDEGLASPVGDVAVVLDARPGALQQLDGGVGVAAEHPLGLDDGVLDELLVALVLDGLALLDLVEQFLRPRGGLPGVVGLRPGG